MNQVDISELTIHRKVRSKGFTLIELMIAVLIVSVLAAIAYPSYKSHLVKTRRSAAQAHLLDVTQYQQQYLLDARAYATDLAAPLPTAPTDVSKYYTITLETTVGPPSTFKLTATPKSNTSQDGDVTMTIDHAGTKTPAADW